MSTKNIWIWRCGHHFTDASTTPPDEAKDSGEPSQPVGYNMIHFDYHCSPNCCAHNILTLSQNVLDDLSGPSNETEVERETRRGLMERRKVWLSLDLTRHAQTCLKAFEKDQALTNDRRRVMGWEPQPTVHLQVPDEDAYFNFDGVDHQKIFDEFLLSKFHKNEKAHFERAWGDPRTPKAIASQYPAPEDVQAAASWTMDGETLNTVLKGMREDKFQDIHKSAPAKKSEAVIAALELAAKADDVKILGKGAEAAGPPGNNPPRTVLTVDMDGDITVVSEASELDFIEDLFIINNADIFTFESRKRRAERIQERQSVLMTYGTHFAFYQPLGPEPKYHAVAYVVRTTNLRNLHMELDRVRDMCLVAVANNWMDENTSNYVYHLLMWVNWRRRQLKNWHDNVATEEVRNQIKRLLEDEALLKSEHEAMKKDVYGVESESDGGVPELEPDLEIESLSHMRLENDWEGSSDAPPPKSFSVTSSFASVGDDWEGSSEAPPPEAFSGRSSSISANSGDSLANNPSSGRESRESSAPSVPRASPRPQIRDIQRSRRRPREDSPVGAPGSLSPPLKRTQQNRERYLIRTRELQTENSSDSADSPPPTGPKRDKGKGRAP